MNHNHSRDDDARAAATAIRRAMSTMDSHIAYGGWRPIEHWRAVMKDVGETLGYPVIHIPPADGFDDEYEYSRALYAAFYDSPRPALVVMDDDALARAPWLDERARRYVEELAEWYSLDNPGVFLTRVSAGDHGFDQDFLAQQIRPQIKPRRRPVDNAPQPRP